MGYETTMLVVDGSEKKGKPVGYQSIIASLELSCCGHKGPMGQLIEQLQKAVKELSKETLNEVSEVEEEQKKCFTSNGDYTPELEKLSEEDKNKRTKKYFSMRQKLSDKLPYVYHRDHNNEEFVDCYGDALLVASVKEVYEALVRDQAETIANKEYDSAYGYRRFHLAIKLLEAFMQDSGSWSRVKVILYGH